MSTLYFACTYVYILYDYITGSVEQSCICLDVRESNQFGLKPGMATTKPFPLRQAQEKCIQNNMNIRVPLKRHTMEH